MMSPKASFWRDLFVGFVVVVSLWRTAYGAEKNTTAVVNVGVVLDLSSWAGKMSLSCINLALSDFNASHPQLNATIVLHVVDSEDDLVLAANRGLLSLLLSLLLAADWASSGQVCNSRTNLVVGLKSEVEAILGPESSFQARHIIQLAEKSEVPIISFAPSAAPGFSYLKSPYFFRVPYNHSSQFQAISDIVNSFGWKQVVTVYQDDQFGKSTVTDLIQALQIHNVHTDIHGIDPAASERQIREVIEILSMKEASVFVVHMVPSLASRVFAMADELGLMSKGYAWIITDATTNGLNSMPISSLSSMQGVLGVKNYVPRTKKLDEFILRWRRKFLEENPDIDDPRLDVYGLWAYDATWALAMAVESSERAVGTDPNGRKIMEALSKIRFKGVSGGEFGLVEGQPESPNLQIVNVIGEGEISTVGYWNAEFNENGKLRPIIWPGYSVQAPKGWVSFNPRKILKIAVPLNKEFKPSVLKVPNILGYCVDIFMAAVNEIPHFPEYEFVPCRPSSYDSLITEVYRGTFDGAVGDITILANRSTFVDFTSPFTEAGNAVVVRARHESLNHAWLFLKPLTWDLWITSFCFFVFMGFVVWILEHKNSEDFRSGPLSQQMGTSLWFSFSIMVFAQRETLRSNLARFVIAIWFFVVFVLTQSYTASLTSWLTVQQLQPVTDINQILKNNWSVGYQRGSYIYDSLKLLGIKKLVPYASTEELHELFLKGGRNGGIDAAIDEIPYMKLLDAGYPGIYTMGNSQYNGGGFGFAFRQGSSLVDDISKAVLKVVQSDRINKINEKWFGKNISFQSGNSDDGSEASSSSLDLSYFSSLFLITASPIISQIPVPSLTVSVERLAAIAFFFTILLSATVAYDVSSDQTYGADSDDEDLVILEVVSLPPSKKLTELQTQKKLDPGAVHCVTLFSDLTESEFRTNFVGVNRLRLSADSQKALILPTGDLASDFDWRDHGAVTLVKEQDSCGLRWWTGAVGGLSFHWEVSWPLQIPKRHNRCLGSQLQCLSKDADQSATNLVKNGPLAIFYFILDRCCWSRCNFPADLLFEWTLPYAPANSLGESCPNAMGIGAGGDLLTMYC
ncbi:Glutamate receptor 2.9, partial [Cucurbita argyrosperma subsp. sororia]